MLRSAAAPQATLQKREVNHVNTKAGQPYHCKDSGPEAMRTRDRPSSAARNPETFACLRPSGGGQIIISGILIPRGEGEAIAKVIDAVVRAEGFASTLVHFAGSEREKLLAGNATITMRRGEKVELRFRLPEGLDWPAKLTPEVYFADHQGPVRIMWQPENRRIYKGLKFDSIFDFNFLNAKEGDAGR